MNQGSFQILVWICRKFAMYLSLGRTNAPRSFCQWLLRPNQRDLHPMNAGRLPIKRIRFMLTGYNEKPRVMVWLSLSSVPPIDCHVKSPNGHLAKTASLLTLGRAPGHPASRVLLRFDSLRHARVARRALARRVSMPAGAPAPAAVCSGPADRAIQLVVLVRAGLRCILVVVHYSGAFICSAVCLMMAWASCAACSAA